MYEGEGVTYEVHWAADEVQGENIDGEKSNDKPDREKTQRERAEKGEVRSVGMN